MGNSLIASGAAVSRFYRATTWIEGVAEQQFRELSNLPGFTRMAAFPDLHPGAFGPVGIAADFDELIHPALIGTDIGCGVALARSDTSSRKIRLDKVVSRLSEAMNDDSAPEFIDGYPTGSIGGGNHFCELTEIREVFCEDHMLEPGNVHVLVHSGSRGLGADIFTEYRSGGIRPLEGDAADRYLDAHDKAVAFAAKNREAVIRRAAWALKGDYAIVSDVPHNHMERVDGVFRHRKGASSADRGLCVVLGSRGALSYLVEPLPDAPAEALATLAHGAGRKFDRAGARARFAVKGAMAREMRNPFGGFVVCADKRLVAEEHPNAYKPIAPVIEDLKSFGLVRVVASLQPLVTWKTGGGER